MNVSLKNFTLNGNQGSGFDGVSTSGTRQGSKYTWFFGINLMNLDNIVIEKVVVVNTPAYHIRFSNVGHVSVSGCVLKSRGLSTDGLHFDGPSNDIKISDCDFATGDDSIALNCPEGYYGSISRVAVTNCSFNSLSLMRLYTANGGPNKFSIDTVSVSNCQGYTWEGAFLIGVANGSNLNSIASLTISDCVITAPTVLALAENFGSIVLRNVSFIPSQSNTVWVPPQANHICAFVRPSPLYGGVTYVGSSLSFENCRIHRYSDIITAALILESGSTIETLAFDRFSIGDAGGSPGLVPNLVRTGSGTIGELVLKSVDSSNIRTPVSEGGFSSIKSVSGAGVLATGWQFPDAVMANGVPYLSASSGLPSIKVGGVVDPYP